MKTVTFEMQKNPQNIYMRIHNDQYLGTPLFHDHTFYEFIWIAKGVVNQIHDNRNFQLKQYDLCILKPETCHSIQKSNVYPTLFYNFEVSKKFVHDFLSVIGKTIDEELFSGPFVVLKYTEAEMTDFMQLLNRAIQESASEEESMSCLKSIIGHALYRIIAYNYSHDSVRHKNPIISACLTALNNVENFPETIERIFSQLGYSHEHITRLFKKEGLPTPVTLLLKNKLEYSRMLLSSSDLKIVDIIELCGFYSPSYYYKTFKEYYGVSPSEYRKA